MIEGFRHKGLRRFYENDDRKLLRPELVQRIRDILTAVIVGNSIRLASGVELGDALG